ncbi:MAG: efflux RND transporter periplasmic adaptor subunit [Akkermansiaceae bacterium]|nr:efflux RND transporter periplasmic adaptor subunit [Akkermansiaceae bacterium]
MKNNKNLQRLSSLVKKPSAILIPLILFFAGWWFALPSKKHDHQGTDTAEKIEVWTCSMHPQIRQPNAGLCPICNMDLIELMDEGNDGGLREITISQQAAALLDLRVSPVLRAPAQVSVKLFGKIDYDERTIVTTTARISGRLDRLYADFTGTTVSKGDAIAEIYSPELYVAQQELIQAVQSVNTSSSPAVRNIRANLLAAAREKLRLLELTDQQITTIEKQRKPSNHITLTAQQDGIIVKLNAKEGQYLKTGDPLFGIAKLSSVWLKMEAYESDLPWLRYAQEVSFNVEAIPEKTFHGRIAFIDPQLDPKRRIVKVRVNVDNQDLLLKPGMFANASAEAKVALHGRVLSADLAGKWISPMHPEIVKDGPGECDICGMALVPAETLGFIPSDQANENPILVPASAVLRTGKRAIVYVRIPEKSEPTFEGREIVLGTKAGDYFIVANGLDPGELVVTHGAYKLDSELQIKARPSMMNPNAGLVESSAIHPPRQILAQWSPLLRAYGELEQAIKNHNIEQARSHLSIMRSTLEQIKTDQLQADQLALWQEFSMRLDNTLSSILSPSHVSLRKIRHQMSETGRFTGLPWHPIPAAKLNTAWILPLQKTIVAYLQISKPLSDDQAKPASQAIPNLIKAIAALPDDSEKAKLLTATQQLQKNTELKELRNTLPPVSKHLIALIKKHGINQLGNLYVVHCPMADQGKGADWLSPIPKVQNPYFGSGMYSCGELTDTLSQESK